MIITQISYFIRNCQWWFSIIHYALTSETISTHTHLHPPKGIWFPWHRVHTKRQDKCLTLFLYLLIFKRTSWCPSNTPKWPSFVFVGRGSLMRTVLQPHFPEHSLPQINDKTGLNCQKQLFKGSGNWPKGQMAKLEGVINETLDLVETAGSVAILLGLSPFLPTFMGGTTRCSGCENAQLRCQRGLTWLGVSRKNPRPAAL